MYTLIILTRLNGFSLHSFPHTQNGFEEARQDATKACRESETEALIYGPEGFVIWRAGGRQSPVAPAAPVAKFVVYDSEDDSAHSSYDTATDAESMAQDMAHSRDRMFYVKNPKGFVVLEATSQPLPKLNFVVSDFTGATVLCKTENLADAIDQAHAFADSLVEVITVWMNGAETRQVYATTGRFPINERGMYYNRQGMLCNVDGTRSIFDDVDA